MTTGRLNRSFNLYFLEARLPVAEESGYLGIMEIPAFSGGFDHVLAREFTAWAAQ